MAESDIFSPTDLAHAALARVARAGMTAVDATCGNGHDTLFLARRLGPTGAVHAFDLQPQAIDATRRRLEDAPEAQAPVTLYRADHRYAAETLMAAGVRSIDLTVFNLGYLPGGDKSLTTTAESTVSALAALAALLSPGGLLSTVLYRAHSGGMAEAEAVLAWSASLSPQEWTVWRYESPQAARFPRPVWLGFWKKKIRA